MRSGLPLTQLVEFTDGFPDGDINWTLLDRDGAVVASGMITPAAGAASVVITVTGAQNTVEAGVLSSSRELQWDYTAGGLTQAGRYRYRLDAFLPLGVSEDSVRHKLGVELHELEDEAIDLPAAYGQFQEMVGAGVLAAVTGFEVTQARDAIEATAALALIPALQVKLATKQSSGTDQFQRGKIDWDAVRAQLELYVQTGVTALNPQVDPLANYGTIFIPVVRNDPIVGNDQTG